MTNRTYLHVEKGLDLLKSIGVLKDYIFDAALGVYQIYGSNGEHARYSIDYLKDLSASELHAQLILDFGLEEGKGMFYKVKRKLQKLLTLITDKKEEMKGHKVSSIKFEEDLNIVNEMFKKLMSESNISKFDMDIANKLWKRYKQNKSKE